MSVDSARTFLDKWVTENVPANIHPDKACALHLASRCLEAAESKGLTKADLEEAAGEELVDCMMDAQVAGAEAKLDDPFK
jgi:hypothetical protein